ncbi:MAG: hypothetical protein E6772_02375 [Dysgonomonas sp.]|nr:hypothetical protein [Dysgonomonas sp.]
MKFTAGKYLICMLSCIVTCLAINYYCDYRINNSSHITYPDTKLSNVLKFIEKEYVDSLNFNELNELAIIDIVSQLDAHSYYQPNIVDQYYVEDSTSSEILGIEMFIAKI